MDAMNRGDEHGKAMCGEFYFLLRPERRGGPPVLSRESVCVDVNLKDTPRIFASFAFAGVGIISTSFSQRKQCTHGEDVWLRLPFPPLQSCLWGQARAPQNQHLERWQIEHEHLVFSFCMNV